ncbi:enoyl-CoA hydratase-related protein [Halovivax sp.]|uniref:enoyl-CoA hydratase/isomerase family protein n=1 Tax=Halovivax sp. TaxID=1935978 RepID=UPI0025BD7852|nr:enoyl-CoA hydratase-related protein [Halovivax sp.]
MVQSADVTTDIVGDVGRVVMDRPDRHNAMDPEMAAAIATALHEFATDDGVRTIALTGSGGTFNTGADLSTLDGDERDADAIDAVAGPLHDAVRTMTRAPKPVVTGINGVVAGGGLGLALASDVAVMANDARFEYAYPSIGLSGDGGITWLLPRLVGLRRAQSFALLGEPIDAAEAVDRALVTEAVPADEFDDRFATVAADLASGPTEAFARIRRLFFEGTDRGLGRHLRHERESLTGLTTTRDYATGIGTFFEDEDPSFEGR